MFMQDYAGLGAVLCSIVMCSLLRSSLVSTEPWAGDTMMSDPGSLHTKMPSSDRRHGMAHIGTSPRVNKVSCRHLRLISWLSTRLAGIRSGL